MKNTEIAALFKTIADSFQALSDIYSSTTEDAPQPKATVKKEQPKTASEPATDTPTEPIAEVKTYTKEEVRATLSEKAKIDGCKYKAEVKAIVAKYSEDGTLTKVPEDKYSELMAELEVVDNA
ncbi:MAG: hypothetical protein UHU19_07920 [Lachnospiraceae bacterium]|nr:hypothetical protein [Lachnospiraceae bacterium]